MLSVSPYKVHLDILILRCFCSKIIFDNRYKLRLLGVFVVLKNICNHSCNLRAVFGLPKTEILTKILNPQVKFFFKIWTICQFASDSFELNNLDLNWTCVKASFKLCETFCQATSTHNKVLSLLKCIFFIVANYDLKSRKFVIFANVSQSHKRLEKQF